MARRSLDAVLKFLSLNVINDFLLRVLNEILIRTNFQIVNLFKDFDESECSRQIDEIKCVKNEFVSLNKKQLLGKSHQLLLSFLQRLKI